MFWVDKYFHSHGSMRIEHFWRILDTWDELSHVNGANGVAQPENRIKTNTRGLSQSQRQVRLMYSKSESPLVNKADSV